MSVLLRRDRLLLGAALIALVGSCAKDKTTVLSVKLQILEGAIDQIRIDALTVGDAPVPLAGDEKLFPASAPGGGTRAKLKDGDTFAIWFSDSAADEGPVVMTATGLLCGEDATPQVMTTPARMLAKGQTVEVTLALASSRTGCTTGSGGAGGASGRGGQGGSGGAAGTGGGSGAGGAGGSGGIAGRGGSGGTGGSAGTTGTGGTAGTGTAGRGGTGGSAGTAGTGGAAGRGGTGGSTGSAGTGGAAGRGGAGGTAGTGGAAGRGGTGGSAGTAGTGGAPSICSTAAVNASASPAGALPPQGTTSCGYPVVPGGTAVQYMWTTNPLGWAMINPAFSPNGVACGRCAELVRTIGANTKRVVVTVVGICPDAACQSISTLPYFQLSPAAYSVLSQNEPSIPGQTGDILTMSYVECPVPTGPQGQPERIRANFNISGGALTSVVFVGHRFGIASASVVTTSGQLAMSRNGNSNGYWIPANGNNFGTGPTVQFRLTDTNNRQLMFDYDISNPPYFGETTAQFLPCAVP
jgi:hypothetical protein